MKAKIIAVRLLFLFFVLIRNPVAAMSSVCTVLPLHSQMQAGTKTNLPPGMPLPKESLPTNVSLYPNKGRFFIYWGWNRESYSAANIHFTGSQYNFTLAHVLADDKPSPFKTRIYLNPSNMTIPQYNFRIGYFFNNKYSVSLGADHMKYVVKQNQVVKISGHISGTGTAYDGDYLTNDIKIEKGFLELEHTDGLNYVNADIRRADQLFQWKFLSLNTTAGIGTGFLVPRTDATLLHFERNDKFHIAGFGLSGVIGLQVKFGNYFFIQSEFKTGYIHMPDIRTTALREDKASESFFFHQYNVLFGSYFQFGHPNP